MHITAAAARPVPKREPPPTTETSFHLPDLVAATGHLAADTVGWPLAPPPHLLGPTSTPSPTTVTCAASTAEPAVLPGFPSKRLNWTRRLVITKQPASEFYKDEGGKANALEVEVTLVEFNELGESARSPDKEFIDIPLRILLFFESGKRVDDTDQEIFRFVGNDYDSVVIRASTRKALVQFRLEKVSRRKDGQRFKLRIEVDQEQCTANVADLTPVFTNAICVLSKRKHPSSYNSDSSVRVREPPPKVLKRDLTSMEERLNRKIDGISAQVHHLIQLIHKQNETKHNLPPVPPMVHCPPSDSSILELLLRSNTVDEGPWPKPEPHLFPNAVMPYFEIADEPYHGVEVDLTPAPVPHPVVTPSTTSTTTTTLSDVRSSEMTKPTLPFGDI
ncbi:BolA protein [Phytophthora cinnamomi]|uniref:BolA protein n=1 Tax=Phytophthora cinnamomi TaxID=4785 RepID=UPI00355ABEBE|nr:BolA protein [Phytophthora cinnamomi]